MPANKISGSAPKVLDSRKPATTTPVTPKTGPVPAQTADSVAIETAKVVAKKSAVQGYQGSTSANFLASSGFEERLAPAAAPGINVAEVGEQAAARARAIVAAQAKLEGGNLVSRGFNAFTNMFHRNMSQMEEASKNAVRIYQTELPRDLALYHDMVTAAGSDKNQLQKAKQFLQGAMAKADEAGKQFDKTAKAFGAGNKFWSGLTADVGSGLLVMGGVALCITGFGAPIGAGMIAGGMVAGGALNVGAHALLDNQYDIKREGLANFAVGGISAGATVLTAGLGTSAVASVTRMGIQQGTIGGFTGMAGSVASETSNGWQAGATGRVMRSTLIGGTVGTVLGAGSGAVAQKFISPTLSASAAQAARTGLGSASGATGAALGGVVNEGIDGFQEGWQDRVVRQGLGGALSGAAYSMAPNLAARNQAVKNEIAMTAAVANNNELSTRPLLGFKASADNTVSARAKAETLVMIGAPVGSRLEALFRRHIDDGTLILMPPDHPEFQAALKAGLVNQNQIDCIQDRIGMNYRTIASVDGMVRYGQQAVANGDAMGAKDARYYIPKCVSTPLEAKRALEFLGHSTPKELAVYGQTVGQSGKGNWEVAALFYDQAIRRCNGTQDFLFLHREIPPGIPVLQPLRVKVETALGPNLPRRFVFTD